MDFGGRHDVFISRILLAAAAGEPAACRFLASLAGRHPKVLVRLIRDAQQDGALVDENPLQVACFPMASVGLPRILAAAWQGPPLFGKTLSATLGRIARDPERVLQRLDWAIQGLTPRGR